MSIHSVVSFIRPDWKDFISNIREIKIFRINFIHQGPLYLLKHHYTQQLPLPTGNNSQWSHKPCCVFNMNFSDSATNPVK